MTAVERVLVTGASGFIGQPLCRSLAEQGLAVRAASRSAFFAGESSVEHARVESLSVPPIDIFDNVGTVIHLAGRAHAPRLSAAERERVFAEDARMTSSFCEAAASAGVGRFVFVSTIKVNGEFTADPETINEHTADHPQDAYARGKQAAEQAVMRIAQSRGMEWIVVRPVLVVGEAARGNLDTLLRWLAARRPLPFAGLRNRRSLIALEDLSELLRCCVTHPNAAEKILLASGNETLSTTDICTALAEGLGVQPRLFRVPRWAWSAARAFPPTRSLQQRLAGSLHVDNSTTRQLLGWQPQVSVRDSLVRLAASYRISQ